MANCINCGAALPWAGKSCAFCGTPVSKNEPIEGIAVAAADTTAEAAAVAMTAAALPSDSAMVEDWEIIDYQARSRRRALWGFVSGLLGILLLAMPIPTGEERALRPASLVSWDGITAMVESYSPGLEQYSTIGQSGNWATFAIGTLIGNLVYIGTGLLLIVMGIIAALRVRRLPRWAFVTLPLVYVSSLLIGFNAYYRLIEYVYTQLQGIPMIPLLDFYRIIFGLTEVNLNWGSLITNVVVPILVLLVGVFGGSKDPDFGAAAVADEREAFEEFDEAAEQDLATEPDTASEESDEFHGDKA